MSIIVRKPEDGGDIKPIPTGMHPAICIKIYDLGTQYSDLFDTSAKKVLLMWEIPEQRIVIESDDGKKQDLPRGISKIYTQSLHEKSNLRKDLESWRSKPFTDEELEGFDLEKVLGKGCTLQIIHKTKGDRVFANILNVLPANGPTKEPENDLISFSFQRGDSIPKNTPKWIEDMIKSSEEWPSYRDDYNREVAPDENDVPF